MKKGLPSIRELLRATFGLLGRNASFYLGYSAWLLLPITITLIAYNTLPEEAATIIDILASVFGYGVITVFVSALFIRATPILLEENEKPENLTQNAWALVIPFLLTSILVGLIVTGGIIALVVPGIIFSIWFVFATSITVLEEKKPIESIKISKELVKGRFWPIAWRYFGVALLFILVYMTLAAAIVLIFFFIGAPMESAQISTLEQFSVFASEMTYNPSIELVTTLRLLDIIFIPIGLIFSTIFYLEAKKTQEVDS
jgi:hypothetical protein